ncbi:GxxExxY protein [Spiribacter halobius]|uniref:GxxExxY protein n=1 Tax=Sediminicurvatus halobius TaxID=2182432 RepID=A0A2U2N158_9GAMM|nr:GxxExxY protein [Spiribacter halobius]PWG62981.1 GxxExxY protein [Spiribacter halobius]UEX77497.1 GxxExxY protein [Spiribacter halobius]
MKHNDTTDTTKHDAGRENDVARGVLDAAFEVHRALGSGLLESSYEIALCHELRLRGLAFRRQVPVTVAYKGVRLDAAYRMDLVAECCVIVEVKAVERLERIHEVQLLTYLRHTQLWLGLLINFHAPLLRDGVRRVVHGSPSL